MGWCVYVTGAGFFDAEDAVRQPIVLWQPDLFFGTLAAVVVLVTACSLFKVAQLRSGGGYVARSMGGREVEQTTQDADERMLMNIVEEMSIASGVPMPEVYVLPEEGINAFAAGFTPADAVVAVTHGCIRTLNRDELQGVVAHEFSHILNGDMRMKYPPHGGAIWYHGDCGARATRVQRHCRGLIFGVADDVAAKRAAAH